MQIMEVWHYGYTRSYTTQRSTRWNRALEEEEQRLTCYYVAVNSAQLRSLYKGALDSDGFKTFPDLYP